MTTYPVQNGRDPMAFVRRVKCLHTFTKGRVYYGRGRADPVADAQTLAWITANAQAIRDKSLQLVRSIQ